MRWRDVLGTPWTVQVGLGVHFFKPSADVEVALARSWRDREERSWTLEVRLAALDAFNEAIFQGLGVRADEVDAHYDYAGAPLAARTTLRAAASRWRAELHAGSSRKRGTGDLFRQPVWLRSPSSNRSRSWEHSSRSHRSSA